MMADILICSHDARFSMAELRYGISTGNGGSVRLVHALGKSKTTEIFGRANLFDAD